MRKGNLLIAVVLVALAGCAPLSDLFEREQSVPLSEVPDLVLKAAREAVAGIVFTEAEVEEEDGRRVYEIEGEADGKEYEIEVTEDGEVLEIEEG